MPKLKAISVAIGLFIGAHWLPANAGLIDQGQFATDTNTGLSWLKLNVLAGYSYIDVQNGALGYTSSGWRFATGPELVGLFSNYVGPDNGLYGTAQGALTPAYFDSASELVLELGVNVAFNDPRAVFNFVDGTDFHLIAIQGFYDDGGIGANDGFAEASAVDHGGPSPYGRWGLFPDFLPSSRGATPNVSSFLVRDFAATAVPEPSALWIFGGGLLLLSGFSGFTGRKSLS